MQASDIIRKIVDLGQKYEAQKIILFGSFATDTFHKTSDIDIALKIDKQNFTKIQKAVKKLPTLRKIDLINLNDEGLASNLLEAISADGKILYEKI